MFLRTIVPSPFCSYKQVVPCISITMYQCLPMSQYLPMYKCAYVPMSSYVNGHSAGSRSGFVVSAFFVLSGAAVMFLINIHKNRLRRQKKRSRCNKKSRGGKRMKD